jgi:hypothetical protein
MQSGHSVKLITHRQQVLGLGMSGAILSQLYAVMALIGTALPLLLHTGETMKEPLKSVHTL